MMPIPYYLLYSNIISALQSHQDLVNPSNQEHGNHRLEDWVQANAFHLYVLAALTFAKFFARGHLVYPEKLELNTYPAGRFSASTAMQLY